MLTGDAGDGSCSLLLYARLATGGLSEGGWRQATRVQEAVALKRASAATSRWHFAARHPCAPSPAAAPLVWRDWVVERVLRVSAPTVVRLTQLYSDIGACVRSARSCVLEHAGHFTRARRTRPQTMV